MRMSDVVITRTDAVQIITINRPERRNALNGSAARMVRAAIDELESDADLRVAVLTGVGGTFSSGMDLRAFATGDRIELPGGVCGITETLPSKPVVAAVEGSALGAGLELLLACDLIVAGEGAQFGLPEVGHGLVAGGGGALLLPRLIPRPVALEMLMTGQPIGAARAYEVGLINRVVPSGSVLDVALDVALQIAAHPPRAVATARRIAHWWSGGDEGADWRRQGQMVAELTESPEALAAAEHWLSRGGQRG
jgi:enoyl-CoA hydratase